MLMSYAVPQTEVLTAPVYNHLSAGHIMDQAQVTWMTDSKCVMEATTKKRENMKKKMNYLDMQQVWNN